MPASSPRNAITRQWELLQHLPSSSPGKSAAKLRLLLQSAGYEVTKRTVERDLEALEQLFPITHGGDATYDWHWVKGSAFGVMGLSTTDALSMHLLQRFLSPILPTALTQQLEPLFELAATKLSAQKDNNTLGRWSGKVAVVQPNLPVIAAPIDTAAMQTVQEALLAEEQISVDYLRADGQVSKPQPLNPLGLVQCGAITYLVATGFNYPTPRIYAMHRMRQATRLYLPAVIPEGFSLQGFIEDGGLQFGAVRQIELTAWVSPMLAAQLRETRLTDNQQLAEAPNNGFELTASLPYSWRLRWWILSKTGDIEVLAPTELRAEIADMHRAAVRRYQNDPAI